MKYDTDKSLILRFNFKYDEKGNLIEQNWYNPDNSLQGKWLFKYDKKGLKTEEVEYKSDGSISSKYIFIYDNNGYLIEHKSYVSNGELAHKILFKNNNIGLKTEEIRTRTQLYFASDHRKFYIYDKFGNVIEEKYYSDDIESKTTYRYDDK